MGSFACFLDPGSLFPHHLVHRCSSTAAALKLNLPSSPVVALPRFDMERALELPMFKLPPPLPMPPMLRIEATTSLAAIYRMPNVWETRGRCRAALGHT